MRRRLVLAALLVTVAVALAAFLFFQGRDGWTFTATDGMTDAGVLGRASSLRTDATWTRESRTPHEISGLYAGAIPRGTVLVLEFTTSHAALIEVGVSDRAGGAYASGTCRAAAEPERRAESAPSVEVRVDARADGCGFTLTFLGDVENATGATLTWRARDGDLAMRPWTLAFRAA